MAEVHRCSDAELHGYMFEMPNADLFYSPATKFSRLPPRSEPPLKYESGFRGE